MEPIQMQQTIEYLILVTLVLGLGFIGLLVSFWLTFKQINELKELLTLKTSNLHQRLDNLLAYQDASDKNLREMVEELKAKQFIHLEYIDELQKKERKHNSEMRQLGEDLIKHRDELWKKLGGYTHVLNKLQNEQFPAIEDAINRIGLAGLDPVFLSKMSLEINKLVAHSQKVEDVLELHSIELKTYSNFQYDIGVLQTANQEAYDIQITTQERINEVWGKVSELEGEDQSLQRQINTQDNDLQGALTDLSNLERNQQDIDNRVSNLERGY